METLIFGLLVLFVALFIISLCYLMDANYKNTDLQIENSDLLYRCMEAETNLEEARQIISNQDKIIDRDITY